jgi:hypothetical protein
MGPAEPVDVGVGLGNGGGETLGELLGNGGGTKTPGPFGMMGRGKAAPGLSDGEGEGDGDSPESSSSSGEGDGEAADACATVSGIGKHGVLMSARARAWPAGVEIEGLAACPGSAVPAISVSAIATATSRRTNDLL